MPSCQLRVEGGTVTFPRSEPLIGGLGSRQVAQAQGHGAREVFRRHDGAR